MSKVGKDTQEENMASSLKSGRAHPRRLLPASLLESCVSVHLSSASWGVFLVSQLIILEALCPQLEAESTWNCTLEEKKSIKSQKRALFRFQRWLGNLNNFEVGVVKPKEPVNAVIKKKERKKKRHIHDCSNAICKFTPPPQPKGGSNSNVHPWTQMNG